MTAIRTKYHTFTATKPTRISARILNGRKGKRIFITSPDGDTDEQRHFKAAEALCKKLGWRGVMVGGWLSECEYVFCFYTHTQTPQEKGGIPIHQSRYIVE